MAHDDAPPEPAGADRRATDPPELKTQYPHVDGVADWRAQQSLRLLWDRTYDLEARLQGAEGTQATLIATANDHQTQITLADRQAKEALAKAQGALAAIGSGSGGGGGTGGGGKDDLGLGAEGCAAAGATGHLTGTFDLTVQSAGKIVCGVGAEFPALLAATPTYVLRQANRDELMERMVWHLNQAGFAASRYGTPGTPEHEFNLLMDCLALDGSGPVRQYAYLVTTYDPAITSPWDTTHTIQTIMKCNGQTPGTTTTPGAGTPD